MDGFTDTLSQHFGTPEEMIAANGQADAENMKSLQEQVDKYEDVLDKFNESVASLDKKINEMQPAENAASSADTEEYVSKLSGIEGKLQDHIHKENVRVYRNVQASVVDELTKQTDTLTAKMDELMAKMSEIESSTASKLNATQANIDKYNEENGALLKKASKGKAVLALQIIMFIAVVADLALNVIEYFNIVF